MAKSRNYSNQSIHYMTTKKKAGCKTEERKCMCCGKTFDSEGIHNRICSKCKTTSAWQSGNEDVASLAPVPSRKGKSE